MPTILIASVLAALFVLAIRHLFKHGACDCSSKGGCSGSYGSCPHRSSEKKHS